jgi:hypothetical protein
MVVHLIAGRSVIINIYTYKGLTGEDSIIVMNLVNLEKLALLISLHTKHNNISLKTQK